MKLLKVWDYNLTILLAVMMALSVMSCRSIDKPAQPDWLASQELSDLEVLTRDGRQLHFSVYLASTRAQRGQGLSFVTNLPLDHGLLLVLPTPRQVTMWMKDTPISLDMVFTDAQGVVTQVVKNTSPNSSELIASDGNVYAVLEVNAGTAQRLDISPGDSVRHRLLNSKKMESEVLPE
ncbi:MAG TPA: DUF192 domain-containing protein [Gammaproteobacteria bacterium]